MEIENNKGEELTPLNLIIIFLSLYVLGALIIETFADIPENFKPGEQRNMYSLSI